jgi:hypothetical protein
VAHRGPAERGIEVVSVLFIDRFWLSRTLPIWEVDDALQLGSRLSPGSTGSCWLLLVLTSDAEAGAHSRALTWSGPLGSISDPPWTTAAP